MSDFGPVLRAAVIIRAQLADQADESAAIVRAKEKTLAALHSADGPLGRYTRVLDLWCAAWFWPNRQPPDRGTFGDLVDLLLERGSALPARTANPFLELVGEAAVAHRFLH